MQRDGRRHCNHAEHGQHNPEAGARWRRRLAHCGSSKSWELDELGESNQIQPLASNHSFFDTPEQSAIHFKRFSKNTFPTLLTNWCPKLKLVSTILSFLYLDWIRFGHIRTKTEVREILPHE